MSYEKMVALAEAQKRSVLYECGICGCLHPWEFDGDCRDDANRYGDSLDYAARHGVSDYDIDVLAWDERRKVD